jgi:predicted alpha/beta hydrolase
MTLEINPVATTISARDGFRLAATLREPASPAAAADTVALIASATAVKQTLYRHFAAFLASRGVPALTFDYRGIGQSRPASLKGFRAFMHEWGTRDLPAVIDWLTSRYPDARVVVVGHSVGGQLVGLAENNRRVHALIGVCAQSGDLRLWKGLRKYLLAALWYLAVPGLTRGCGYFPARKLGLGEDLPAGVALEWAKWCRSPGYLSPHLGESLPDYFRAFRGPILAYSFADDPLGPRNAVEALLRMYSRAASIERRHLDPRALGLPRLGHFGFFRKESAGLWPETADWIRAAGAGVPPSRGLGGRPPGGGTPAPLLRFASLCPLT